MTEEIKEEKKCNCCISPEYKQFLLTILASFLGCLVALCLYSAAMKPQLPPPPCGGCPIKKMHQFHKGFPDKHFQKHRIHRHGEFKPDQMRRNGEFPPVKPNKN